MYQNCPIETTLDLISGKWKTLILRELVQGPVRYGVILKDLGNISPKVLTQQLRDMEDSGLILRNVYPEVPPRVEYSLTEKGTAMRPILLELGRWGMANYENCGQDCKTCGRCMPKSNPEEIYR